MNQRQGLTLREQLAGGSLVRIVGVHDGLTALLAQQAGFEALWAGGFAVSATYGLPDAGLLTMTEMQAEASRIRRASHLPLVVDVDAGFGDLNVIQRMVRLYEGSGAQAICIEDKQYPKRNSFRDGHVLEVPQRFADRLAAATAARSAPDFLIVARIESFIAGAGLDDAVARARLYRAAGADALVIHSRSRTPDEVEAFCDVILRDRDPIPVIGIPTTYFQAGQDQLAAIGLSGAIYANQILRACVRSTSELLRTLAEHGSTAPAEDSLCRISDVFELVNTHLLIGDDPWQELDGVWAGEKSAAASGHAAESAAEDGRGNAPGSDL